MGDRLAPDSPLQDVAVLIDRAPQVVNLPVDRDEDLVDMPDITKPPFSTLESTPVIRTELPAPPADRFIGHLDTALGKEIFDIAEAQSESVVHPDRVADDLGRKSVAVVSRFALAHELSLRDAGST